MLVGQSPRLFSGQYTKVPLSSFITERQISRLFTRRFFVVLNSSAYMVFISNFHCPQWENFVVYLIGKGRVCNEWEKYTNPGIYRTMYYEVEIITEENRREKLLFYQEILRTRVTGNISYFSNVVYLIVSVGNHNYRKNKNRKKMNNAVMNLSGTWIDESAVWLIFNLEIIYL